MKKRTDGLMDEIIPICTYKHKNQPKNERTNGKIHSPTEKNLVIGHKISYLYYLVYIYLSTKVYSFTQCLVYKILS